MKEAIAIINRRGGIGKTTTAHALGAGLAREGYKTLFVDVDSQCNLTYSLGADDTKLTSMDVLTGRATAKETIQHTPGGDIIPAGDSLAVADTVLTGNGKEYRLKKALESLKGEYDYIIIDTPPALGILIVNALTASNSIIIPAQAEIYSLQGVARTYKAVRTIREYTNPELKIKGILIVQYQKRVVVQRDMKTNLEMMAEQIGTKVFSTPIRTCSAIKEAQAVQMDIYTYSPGSNGTADYKALVREILEEGR